jgi:hypothetical protein
MTDIEAYAFIEQQYIDAFGENFRLAHALGMPQGLTKYSIIGSSFYFALTEHFNLIGVNGGALTIFNVNRERLFGEATDDEIFDYIRAKYPETLTYHDFILMHDEMRSVGLFNNESDWSPPLGRNGLSINCLRLSVVSMGFNHPDIPWEDYLQKPINIPYLLGNFNLFQWQGEYDRSPMLTEFIKNIFGGILDERNWFIGGIMPWDQFGGRF